MDYLAARIKIAAIGCSFTNYIWPTYADILDAVNFGLPGIGNERIWAIIYYLYKNRKLQRFDYLIVQWSSPFRFDYRTSQGWTTGDGTINKHKMNNRPIWRAISNWYNEEYEIEKSENYIKSIKDLCKDINLPNFHMSMSQEIGHFVDLPDIMNTYKEKYLIKRAEWTSKPFEDEHPTIASHIEIAKHIGNIIGVTPDPIMLQKCMQFHDLILTEIPFEKITKYYKSHFPDRYVAAGF